MSTDANPHPLEADELAHYDDGQYDGDPTAPRIEVAATGHLVAVVHHPDDADTPWAVTIGAGEGPGMELMRVSDRQPADLLVADLRNALEYVVAHPARPIR